MKDSIIHITSDLSMINLKPPIPGFDNFIGSWLYRNSNFTALVDVGPASTADQLLSALSHLKVKNLDYILLTHIHLDHAGAIGKIIASFNNTKIICHEMGIPHLINSEKLWKGSFKTLGEIATSYGTLISVKDNIVIQPTVKDPNTQNLRIIKTPGHSPHHISIILDNYIFIGEAAGVMLKVPTAGLYLRPATPHRFFIKTYLESMNLILKVNPKILCYGHLGAIHSKYQTIKSHHQQLKLWESTIQRIILSDNYKNERDLVKKCIYKLLKIDPLLSPIKRMSKNTKKREIFFIENSIKGFVKSTLNIMQ